MLEKDLVLCIVRHPVGDEPPSMTFVCEPCAEAADADGQEIGGVPRHIVRRALNARDEWRLDCHHCQTNIPLIPFERPKPEGENPFANLVEYEDDSGGFVRDGYQVFTLLPDPDPTRAMQDGAPLKVNDTIWLLHHTVTLADSVLAYCLPPVKWHDQPKQKHIEEASENGQMLVVRVNAPMGMPVNTEDVEANALRMYADALGLKPGDSGYPAHVFMLFHTLKPEHDIEKEVLSFRQEVYRRMGLGRYPEHLVPVDVQL
jgi:hypothetical protein